MNVELLTVARNEALAGCGIPPALFATGDGTAQRESFRRFLRATVQPLANIVQRELSAKLDAVVTLNFDRLFAADLAGELAGPIAVYFAVVTVWGPSLPPRRARSHLTRRNWSSAWSTSLRS